MVGLGGEGASGTAEGGGYGVRYFHHRLSAALLCLLVVRRRGLVWCCNLGAVGWVIRCFVVEGTSFVCVQSRRRWLLLLTIHPSIPPAVIGGCILLYLAAYGTTSVSAPSMWYVLQFSTERMWDGWDRMDGMGYLTRVQDTPHSLGGSRKSLIAPSPSKVQ